MALPLGVNSWVWTSPFTDAQTPLIARAARLGFDLFEIPVEDPDHFSRGKVAGALRDAGLGAVVCGVFPPFRDLSSADAGPRRACLQYLRQAIRLGEQWQAKVLCGPAYTGVGRSPYASEAQRRAARRRAVRGLREAARMAADAGMTLALEPLNRFETDLVNTAEQGKALVAAVDHPAVGLHLDTFHMNIEETSLREAVLTAGSALVHVHACENDRGAPGGGQVRWSELKAGLKEISYPGAVVIESFTPACKSIARAAAVWRPVAASPDRLAADGLAYLRRLWPRPGRWNVLSPTR